MMLRNQRGLSLWTLLFGGALFGLVFLLVMKLIPAYSEYAGVRNALVSLAKNNAGASPSDLRELFDKRAQIDNIKEVRGSDLEILQNKGSTSVGVSYDKEVPLFHNVSLLFHFQAEARGGSSSGGE